jgi:outer membrane protein OmpA-like peptidoglycan-associated protein
MQIILSFENNGKLYGLLILSILIFCSCGPEKRKSETWKERINEYTKKYPDSISPKKSYTKVSDTVITVYFKKKSLQLSPEDTLRLTQLASFCTSDIVSYIKIVGFTDTTGTEAQNDILSEKRTDKVLKYLDRQHKIKSDGVYVTWLGESEDVYDLHFQPTHPRKNCVDIWFQLKRTSR